VTPGSQPLLVSALRPSRQHERAALAVAVVLFAFFVAVLPRAGEPVGRSQIFVPIIATVMFLSDSITAVLLFGQFSVVRSRALLCLAGGYLFTALLVVAYALTFPGAFSPGGLLGAGLQTPGWIFVIWHVGLPTTVIAYALLGRAPVSIQRARAPVPMAIAATVANVVAIVSAITWAAIAYNDWLPVLVVDLVRLSGLKAVVVTVFALCTGAVILLWRRRRSILDLWLLVVSFAWLLDAVFMYMTESRYSVAWYANRLLGIVSANVVLFVLLAESTALYAQLAIATLAERRERESRMMTMEAMSAAIEHEIRQPLAAIAANAGAAQRWIAHSPPNLGEVREAIGSIHADSRRATDVLHSVRALFSERDDSTSPVDVNEVVVETVSMLRAELERAGIGVQLDLAPQLQAVVGNRNQLQEVILNLVKNAADAMDGITDRPAMLRIQSSPIEPHGVAVIVADTGAGIDPAHMERIFDAFFTTKRNGMGMGLAICRSIVERHGGTLSASPGVRHGSVFRMTLVGGVSRTK